VRRTVGVVVLIALFWLIAARGIGMSLVVPALLERVAPEGSRVEVGSVAGDWRSEVTLRGIEVMGPDLSASIASVHVRYRLLPLLRRTVEIEFIGIETATIEVEMTPRSKAERARASPASDRPDDARPASALAALLIGPVLGDWTVEVGRVTVGPMHARVRGSGGSLELSGSHVSASATLGPDGARLALDSLAGDVLADELPGRLSVSGALADGVLELGELSFVTSRSSVEGAGTLALVPGASPVERVDFTLAAEPLDLRDLPFALPEHVHEDARVNLEVVATGQADSIVVRAGTRGPGALLADLSGVVRSNPPRSARAAEGAPVVELDLEVSGADLSGWAPAPFDGTARASVAGAITRFASDTPLRASGTIVHEPDSAGGPSLTGGALRADFTISRLDGDRSGPASTDSEVSVTLLRSTAASGADGAWDRLGEIEGRTVGPRMDWSVDLAFDSASVRGSGSARSGTSQELVVDGVDVRALDLRRVLADLPRTSVHGRIRGRVGRGPTGLDGSMRVTLEPTRIAELSVDTADVVARFAGDTVEGRLLVHAPDRRLDADYRASLEDSVVHAGLASFRYVEVATPSGADTVLVPVVDTVPEREAIPLIDVNGHATARWDVSAARRGGALRVTIDSSRVRAAELDGRITADVDGDRIAGDAELDVRDGGAGPFRVHARVDALGRSPAVMTGSLDIRARRPEGQDGNGTDSLVATVTAERAGELDLAAALHAAEGGALVANGSATLAGQSVRSFRIVAGGGFTTPTALLRQATIDTVTLEVSGERDGVGDGDGDGDGWDLVDARVDLEGLAWRTLVADTVRLDLRSDSGGLRLDTLRVDSNVLTLAGGGALPRGGGSAPGRVDVTARLHDLDPVRRILDAQVLAADSGQVIVTATGNLDSLSLVTSGYLRAVVSDAVGLSGVDVEATALLEPPFADLGGLVSGTLDLSLDRLVIGDTDIREMTLHADGGPDSVAVETSALVDDLRRGTLAMLVDPRPDQRTARIETFDLQLDEDQWALAGPAVLSYRDGYSVASFMLRAGEQEIEVDGGLGAGGALDLRIEMDSTDIGTVSDLVGLDGLDGWIGGSIQLEGTRSRPEGTVDIAGAFHRTEGRPAPARIRLRSDGRSVQADVDLVGPGDAGGHLSVDGTIPLPDDDGDGAAGDSGAAGRPPLELTATADSFDVAWALPFIDSDVLAELEGRLEGALTITGSGRDPRFDGSMRIRDGGARLPSLGVEWERISGVARGQGAELALDSLRVVSGSGELRVAGTVTLSEGTPLDLDAELDGFEAIDDSRYRATASGEVHVGGTAAEPVLEGRLQIESLDLFLDEQDGGDGLRDVALTEEDLRMLRDRFGYVPDQEPPSTPFAERLTATLAVELGRDSWLRKDVSPEMAIAFTGDIDVELRPGEEPDLQGSVEPIAGRGFVEQFGRRFDVREGTVTFDGPPSAVRLDLSAEYAIPSHDNPDAAEATIVLDIEGTRDSLSLSLSSEPPMENADIVSYIATGRPASGSLSIGEGDGDGGLVDAGAGLAVGQIVGAIEGAAAQSIGLDVVEIRREGLRQATVVAGKYVSPRVYIGFATPVTLQEGDGSALEGEGESEVEVELEALRWLLINIEGSGSALRFFLRGRYAY
jgi:hypothetical protein